MINTIKFKEILEFICFIDDKGFFYNIIDWNKYINEIEKGFNVNLEDEKNKFRNIDFIDGMKLYTYNKKDNSSLMEFFSYLQNINIVSDSNLFYCNTILCTNKNKILQSILSNGESYFIGDMKKMFFLYKYIKNKLSILSREDILKAENVIDIINEIGFEKIYYGLDISEEFKIKEIRLFVYYLFTNKKCITKIILFLKENIVIDIKDKTLLQKIKSIEIDGRNFINITKINHINLYDGEVIVCVLTSKQAKLINEIKSKTKIGGISRSNLCLFMGQKINAFERMLGDIRMKIKKKKIKDFIKCKDGAYYIKNIVVK